MKKKAVKVGYSNQRYVCDEGCPEPIDTRFQRKYDKHMFEFHERTMCTRRATTRGGAKKFFGDTRDVFQINIYDHL